MVQYDPAVINQFAESLYLKAEKVVRNYTLRGCLVGFVIGLLLVLNGKDSLGGISGMLVVLAPTALFGYFGYTAGQSAAFKYKLEAQTALCNIKIEENTRKST